MYQPNGLSYTVALQDCRDLPEAVRIDAEARFASELQRVLGGEEYVAETFSAWIAARVSSTHHIDKSTAVIAARWPIAVNAATQAAFSRPEGLGNARFDLRLNKRHAVAR